MRAFRAALATAAALGLCGCYQTGEAPSATAAVVVAPMATPDQLRDLTPAEKTILTKGFAAGLKDPDSAKFQWAKIQKGLPMDGTVDYCAMVNAKNSYGGYIGAQPFIGSIVIAKGKIVSAIMGAVGESAPMYRDILPNMCREKGLDPFAVTA
jgi:hypothetical protein